jgi:hypothetical protein
VGGVGAVGGGSSSLAQNGVRRGISAWFVWRYAPHPLRGRGGRAHSVCVGLGARASTGQPALDGIRFGWRCWSLGCCCCHFYTSVTGITRAGMGLTDGLGHFVEKEVERAGGSW